MFQDKLFEGRRMLVTGGGTGLGRAMVERFAALGARPVILGRRAEVLARAAREIEATHGVPVETHTCDVRDAAAVEACFDRIWEGGPLDALVNNAAGNFLARSETLSPRAFDAVVDIVLKGGAYCTMAAGRRWIAEGRPASVLCILTQSALTGAPFKMPSAVAKAGMLSLIRSLAVEWGPHGIRLVGIAPGAFPTPGASGQLAPSTLADASSMTTIALRRNGRLDELADLAAFLLSPQAGYITGEAIVIDGGKWLQGAAGPSAVTMQGWDDAQWAATRAETARARK